MSSFQIPMAPTESSDAYTIGRRNVAASIAGGMIAASGKSMTVEEALYHEVLDALTAEEKKKYA